MARVKGQRFFKHQRFIAKWAAGYGGRRGNCIRFAIPKVMQGWKKEQYGRLYRRRTIKRLWIQRVGAAAVEHDITYSRFLAAIRRDNIWINRKMLADFALNEPYTFRELAEHSKKCCGIYHIPPSHYFIHKNY